MIIYMTTKICTKCKEEKHVDAFSKKSPSHIKSPNSPAHMAMCKACYTNKQNSWASNNRLRVNEIERRVRQKRKEFVNSFKVDRPCADCGNIYPSYVMDFDHLPDADKVAGLSEMAGLKKASFKRLKEEIDKCELVCANCHRIRTYERRHAMLSSIREEVDLKEALERDVLDSIKAGSKFAHEE